MIAMFTETSFLLDIQPDLATVTKEVELRKLSIMSKLYVAITIQAWMACVDNRLVTFILFLDIKK